MGVSRARPEGEGPVAKLKRARGTPLLRVYREVILGKKSKGLARKHCCLVTAGIASGHCRNTRHETVGHRRLCGNALSLWLLTCAPASLPLSWPQASGLPQDSDRHRLRPEDRHQLGGVARRVGLGLW